MTPQEHYEEAERLLKHSERMVSSDWPIETGERKSDIIAAAQVHATLARAQRGPVGIDDVALLCDHGYAICARCNLVPESWQLAGA